MARIRTIKPEFPQSETIGKLSREARLLFIQLWVFVDDHGRCRGNSRLLAGSLYPYDDDACDLIDGWIVELEKQNCVRRYQVGSDTYLDIPNWTKHQRIDNAGKSRIPEFCGEPPRDSANLSDPPLYLGPRTIGPRTIGPRIEEPTALPTASPQTIPLKSSNRGSRIQGDWEPSPSMVAFCLSERPDLSPESVAAEFRDYWSAQPGQRGVKLDWEATWRNWVRRQRAGPKPNGQSKTMQALDNIERQARQ